MSGYTEKVRAEIRSKLPAASCCRRSLLAGLLLNAESGVGGSVWVRLTGRENVSLAASLISELYGREVEPEYFSSYGREGAEILVDSPKLSSLISGLSDPAKISEKPEFFRCQSCRTAFIGGTVLACGTYPDQSHGARAEFRIKDPARASKLKEMLSESGIFPSLSNRKGDTSLLLKSAEGVEGLAAVAGAPLCAMEMMQDGLSRTLKRDTQRTSNCVVVNLGNAARASTLQLKAIEKLKESGRISLLPPDLRESAMLREANPDASMAELAALHTPPISKSGLNHRMEKILRFAGGQN